MKLVKLNDVIEFARNGAAIKQSEEAKGFPISRIETIWNSTIDENRLGYADIYDEDLIKYEKYLLKENDILITHINSPKHLGKSALYTGYPEKLIHGMNLLCLRNNPNFSNSKYLFYYFQTKYFKNQILKISNQSVNQASFAVTNLKELEIPLPQLPTQQRIAEILDTADQLRQYNKQLIEKYDALTQSLFLEMFGDPVRNEKGWEKIRFDELVSKNCPLTYGIVQPGEEFENGIPCVRPVDLTSQYIKVSNLKKIDPKISSKFGRTLLKGGEILLSVRGSVGVISIADESLKNSNVTRGIVPIWFESSISNKLFFFHLYNTMEIQREIKSLAKGATLIQINLKDLREIKIIKPPISLQNQFAERVEKIETQKRQAQEGLKKSEDLFQSLLQRAFKGELT